MRGMTVRLEGEKTLPVAYWTAEVRRLCTALNVMVASLQ
jgi:hypothetical protein